MLGNPRVWLFATGLWLLLAGLAHAGWHTWNLALENGMLGQREFAMNAMKQAYSPDPLTPSLWTHFRLLSASLVVFLLLWGGMAVTLAWIRAEARVLRAFALLGTVGWTVAFGLYVFVDPVIQPILVAGVAVPLHGIVWMTANEDASGET